MEYVFIDILSIIKSKITRNIFISHKVFNASKVPCISELLNMCDILLLQETWLY